MNKEQQGIPVMQCVIKQTKHKSLIIGYLFNLGIKTCAVDKAFEAE